VEENVEGKFMIKARCLLAVALAFTSMPQCNAQINIPDRADEHTVVALKVDRTFPAGSKVKYRWSAPTLSIGEGTADNKTAYATGAPGAHQVFLTLAWIEGDSLQLETDSGTLVIGDAPPTPPVVVKTLAELAGDKAAILAELLTDLREAALPIAPTTDALKNGLKAGLARAAVPVDHPAAVEIVKRLDACGSGKIDDALRKSLDAALAKAVADLGAKPPVPPTPPVVEGKRLLVIIHETADTTPEQGALFTAIRSGETAKYIKEKGHPSPLILDDESVDAGGRPIALVESLEAAMPAPAMFVLEPTTKAVIAKQALATKEQDVLAFLKANGG